MLQLNKRVNLVICQKSKVNDWVEHFRQYYSKYVVADLTSKKGFELMTYTINNDDFIVGDTINDILCGKELNIKTIALTNGFINKNILEKYQPNYL